MNKTFHLFLFFLIFSYTTIFADATPFKGEERIDIIYKTSNKLQLDSCSIIYKAYKTNELDTLSNSNCYYCIRISDDMNTVRIVRIHPKEFKIIFYYENKVLISPILNQNGLNSYHQLLITNTGIENITPIFKTTYKKYLIALFITILLELTVAFIYFWRNQMRFSNLQYIVYMNLLTHPILWIIAANLTGFTIGNLLGEPMVLIIEAFFLYKLIKPQLTIKKSLWLSFQMNFISFILGGLIYFILTLS
jgi:hypothetical protein